MTSFHTRLAAAALLSACSAGALAQANVQPRDDDGADTSAEIIVTAQKREQRIEDVPVTVTALTGARLTDLGVSELDEIAAFIPGLQVQEQSANNPGFVIRGITSDNGSAQQGARVTLYYNGVDISRSRGAYQDLFDLERIEVVKGPQATLFGTAAAVGAISLISARPRPGFSGEVAGSYEIRTGRRCPAILTSGTTRSQVGSPSLISIATVTSATSPAIPTSPTKIKGWSTRTT